MLRSTVTSANLVDVLASVGVRGRLQAGRRLLGLASRQLVVHLAAPRHVRHIAVRRLVKHLTRNGF